MAIRRSSVMAVLSVLACLLLVGAVSADIAGPGTIKWSQLPNMASDAPDYASTLSTNPFTLVADDFLCNSTGYIDSVHWWGSLINTQLQPDWFNVAFYSYAHDDFSYPGGQEPLWVSDPISPNFYNLTYYGEAGQETVYQYYLDMSTWGKNRFWQDAGTQYFIAIVASYNNLPSGEPNPAVWGWHEAATQWGDDAVAGFLQGNEMAWRPIERAGSSRDVAFELGVIPEPTTLALLGLGLAGIGLKRRKRS